MRVRVRRAECESVLWGIGAVAEAVCGVLGNSPHRRWTVLKFLAWRRSFLRVAWFGARYSNPERRALDF